MTLPKAVSLDIGWTLTYPVKSLWDVFAEVCREADAQLSAAEVEGMLHTHIVRHRKRAIKEFEAGAEYSDSDEAFVALFTAMGRLVFGLAGLADDHEALSKRFLERFWEQDNWAVYPDVVPAIERLRKRGIRVGVLSNATSDIIGFLDQLGLLPYFDFTVVSAIAGFKKPDRRIFELTLEQAGVAPGDAIHVGDMYLEDILGARRAGIRPFFIDRGPLGMFPNHPEAADSSLQPVEIVHTLDSVLAAIGMDE